MKTVQFEIKKLGAIRNSVIEIKPLMLFSGESGLGKSYAAFLVHYFYILLSGHRLVKFFEDNHYDFNGILQNKKNKEVLLRVSVADLIEWINKDAITYIGYLIGHNNFTGEVNFLFDQDQNYFDFFYEEELGGLDN